MSASADCPCLGTTCAGALPGCHQDHHTTEPDALEDVLPLLDALPLAAAAVALALDLACTDPDVRRVIRQGTELWERLCAAEAALLGRPVEEVLAERAALKPVGPRRLMTYDEWTGVRASEIESEGVKGSHWPDKRRAPVQGDSWRPGERRRPGSVAWEEHARAWEKYAARFPGQSAERIAERGGFSYEEITEYLGHEPRTWVVREGAR